MNKNNNKAAFMVALAAIGAASATIVAGVVAKTLKKNLINNLNDEFENFNGYGKCTAYCCPNDSYDEVLRHRKGRYYKKMVAY